MASKIYPSAEAALDGVLFDGMTIMAGGFGLCGDPGGFGLAVQRRVPGLGQTVQARLFGGLGLGLEFGVGLVNRLGL